MTEQEQRRLTEFLGECWHEWRENRPHETKGFCEKCQKFSYRIDFTDWRVLGRLIEKVGGIALLFYEDAWEADYDPCGENIDSIFREATPQEAICRAVLARLEEKP